MSKGKKPYVALKEINRFLEWNGSLVDSKAHEVLEMKMASMSRLGLPVDQLEQPVDNREEMSRSKFVLSAVNSEDKAQLLIDDTRQLEVLPPVSVMTPPKTPVSMYGSEVEPEHEKVVKQQVKGSQIAGIAMTQSQKSEYRPFLASSRGKLVPEAFAKPVQAKQQSDSAIKVSGILKKAEDRRQYNVKEMQQERKPSPIPFSGELPAVVYSLNLAQMHKSQRELTPVVEMHVLTRSEKSKTPPKKKRTVADVSHEDAKFVNVTRGTPPVANVAKSKKSASKGGDLTPKTPVKDATPISNRPSPQFAPAALVSEAKSQKTLGDGMTVATTVDTQRQLSPIGQKRHVIHVKLLSEASPNKPTRETVETPHSVQSGIISLNRPLINEDLFKVFRKGAAKKNEEPHEVPGNTMEIPPKTTNEQKTVEEPAGMQEEEPIIKLLTPHHPGHAKVAGSADGDLMRKHIQQKSGAKARLATDMLTSTQLEGLFIDDADTKKPDPPEGAALRRVPSLHTNLKELSEKAMQQLKDHNDEMAVEDGSKADPMKITAAWRKDSADSNARVIAQPPQPASRQKSAQNSVQGNEVIEAEDQMEADGNAPIRFKIKLNWKDFITKIAEEPDNSEPIQQISTLDIDQQESPKVTNQPRGFHREVSKAQTNIVRDSSGLLGMAQEMQELKARMQRDKHFQSSVS